MTAERACGSCTLCCKVMGIKEIAKPPGQWCSQCQPGKGCGTYQDRPSECRQFICDWLRTDALGPEWKPEKSKIVLVTGHGRIVAYVDPSTPAAWRKSPYHERLMAQVQLGLQESRLVYVSVNENYTLLLPDGNRELGYLGENDEVQLKVMRAPKGVEYQVEVLRHGSN